MNKRYGHEAWVPTPSSSVSTPRPFNLDTEARSGMAAEARARMASEQEESAKVARSAFKAKPARVLTSAPFLPRKSGKPLTEIASFNGASDVRHQERRAERDQNAKKRAARVEAERRAALEKAEREMSELAAYRKAHAFKARPANVLKGPGFQLKPKAAKLTVPESPMMMTKARAPISA